MEIRWFSQSNLLSTASRWSLHDIRIRIESHSFTSCAWIVVVLIRNWRFRRCYLSLWKDATFHSKTFQCRSHNRNKHLSTKSVPWRDLNAIQLYQNFVFLLTIYANPNQQKCHVNLNNVSASSIYLLFFSSVIYFDFFP